MPGWVPTASGKLLRLDSNLLQLQGEPLELKEECLSDSMWELTAPEWVSATSE